MSITIESIVIKNCTFEQESDFISNGYSIAYKGFEYTIFEKLVETNFSKTLDIL